MRQITSLFVWKVIRQADACVDKRALLQSLGLDPGGPVNPSHMVADTDYYTFLETIAHEDPNAVELPLRTGASMRCEEYGAFGLAWKSAPNLRGSYERAERYAQILTSVTSYEVRDTDDGVLMLLHRDGERRLGLRMSNEASIASIAAISQETSAEYFQPLSIYFKHPTPESVLAHERYFGCPVYFNSEKDALLVSKETLLNPNLVGDPAIAKFFDTHLEKEISKLEDDSGLDKRVLIQISQSLSEGVPAVSDIAGRLGMSGRTLQRRLSERGLSFQALVDESRRQLAERLLGQTQYSLTEVAFLTGFSEQSAFTRAFKRWARQTPRSFRIEARA